MSEPAAERLKLKLGMLAARTNKLKQDKKLVDR